MGTRSITFVYEEDEAVVCMYRQFDGYPSGHGAELSDFLDGRSSVNGFNSSTPPNAYNGMGCLAAQMIAYFKTSVGGVYIHAPVQGRDYWQEFEYHVYEDKIIVKNPDEVIFNGTWDNFHSFCSDEEFV